MALRNENMELNQRLAAYEQSEAALSAALVKAEHTASEIISAARERAEGIISEARDEEKKTKERLKEHTLLLADLAERCDNIMKNIQSELKKAPKGFTLELISRKRHKKRGLYPLFFDIANKKEQHICCSFCVLEDTQAFDEVTLPVVAALDIAVNSNLALRGGRIDHLSTAEVNAHMPFKADDIATL